jgi:hypothetical protein
MIGAGSVRGLTAMIATEGNFVSCAVTPTNACKHCQQSRHGVNTVDAPLQERVKSQKKLNFVYFHYRKPFKVDILLSRATSPAPFQTGLKIEFVAWLSGTSERPTNLSGDVTLAQTKEDKDIFFTKTGVICHVELK